MWEITPSSTDSKSCMGYWTRTARSRYRHVETGCTLLIHDKTEQYGCDHDEWVDGYLEYGPYRGHFSSGHSCCFQGEVTDGDTTATHDDKRAPIHLRAVMRFLEDFATTYEFSYGDLHEVSPPPL